MKKIGIITFHNSYNCGSMLQSYALQKYLNNKNIDNEIIDFSNEGQKYLYSVFCKNTSLKNILKNILVFPYYKKLSFNNEKYEQFKNANFKLSERIDDSKKLTDDNYSGVVAGSDQIWNITIEDFDNAYFLSWVKHAKKIAYAPSFGAKNILDYASNPQEYIDFLNSFNALSIRENNGKKWIKKLIGKDVEVLIDPTLLLDSKEYNVLLDNSCLPKKDYIFFYCPTFNIDICKFVKKISNKYKLPVIAWSAKSYYIKGIYRFGFKLPKYENPSVYLSLIKNATLVFTTSFHGTIFSTIYRKQFFTIKNGGMYGNDDRVLTLINSLGISDRLISYQFNEKFDYMKKVDYSKYEKKLPILKEKASKFIKDNIEVIYENTK